MPITSDSKFINVNKIGRKHSLKPSLQKPTLEHFYNISDFIHYTSKQVYTMAETEIIAPTTLLNMPFNTRPVNDNPKVNIDNLHANCTLSQETPSTMATKTRVEIELSPLAWEWMRISVGTEHYQPAKRVIADVHGAREQGLYDLPSQQTNEVVVRLYAPTSDNPGQLFTLFDKVINLVDMLRRRASTIEKVSIVLESLDGQEWHHEQVTISGVKESFFVPWADDCDMMVVPFCSLKNVGDVSVHGHSRELERLIDWKVIDWAVGVVRQKSWEKYVPDPARARASRRSDTTTYYTSYTHRPHRSTPGMDVDRMVAEYYLRIHVNLMRHDFRDTGRHQRRDLLKQSFVYGGKSMNTPPSSFEHDMILIAEEYPDLLRKYDHAIEVLLHMQRIVVCAYERTKPDTHTDTKIVIQYYNWDVAAWELVEGAFKDPLPNMESRVYRECAAELGTFVDYNECLERVVERKNDWLVEVVGVGRFLQDWVHEFVYGRDGEDDDDEDEYSEDEYDEENVEKDDEDHEEENEHECEDEEDKGNDVEEEDKEDESVENEGKDREVDQEAGPRDEDDERQDEAKDEEVQEEENVVDDDKEEDKEEGENEDEGEVYYADDDWDFCEC
ncbi:uncharacterized protein EURHEDRAFT_408062 [Aspergillus ruber CBS 135680]|uniref:Uncharacterized protein n=1 Tax=Aspergillus ruber (strain CBS 135680) TaxID=1388766 RepID=A0A017SRD4_ASPRC|nr:uncharacterized protein EURHEDRAFT_408062 [Aspergillus ruber CBS 135680]EYE98850.1 hypothetical protein EURHEDRAFT_408062 [Aspergillus ruber CBS 135680]